MHGDVPAKQTSAGDAIATGYLAESACFKDLAKMARPLIRRYRLQAEIGAADVANTVLYNLGMATAAGKARKLEPGVDARKFARLLLARVVLQAWRQARSIRRGGSGRDKAPAGGDGGPASGRSLQRVAVDLDGLQATGPTAEELVIASMEVEHLTESLGDPVLKQIARMRLEQYNVGEIAREIGQGHATVSRKLLEIQRIWRESGLESRWQIPSADRFNPRFRRIFVQQ